MLSIFTGPLHVPGSMQAYLAAYFGSPVADPNGDAGPSLFYQGTGLLDPRLVYQKDKAQGYAGVVQAFAAQPFIKSAGAIPSALGAATIAPLANAVTGVPMVLAAGALGITRNVPIRPFSNALNGSAPVTAAIALDFGFDFVNCTAASPIVVVTNSAMYAPGMPLVIAAVGNAGGTIPLLTQVLSITDLTHIVLTVAPLATNAATAVGTGDLWGPSPLGFPAPLAAYPFLGSGPGLFLDPRQALARGVSVTGIAASTGGTVTVAGWDIYGMPMSETITVAAGVATGYGKKAFKYIGTVTPNFTDAHTYSVGTSDLFGFHLRAGLWEDMGVYWNATMMTTSTGFTAFDGTSPATATTGDVRGTIQTGAAGAGAGIGANASNGALVGLVMTGRRLEMRQLMNTSSILAATPAAPVTMFGVAQV